MKSVTSQKMLYFMQTSESEEGPSTHKSLTYLGKLTQMMMMMMMMMIMMMYCFCGMVD